MELPLQITFRDFPPSPALEKNIRNHAHRLERFHDRIVSCRVLVEEHHRRHRKGNLFHVRIELGVPGREIVVSHEPHDRHQHEDPYVAVRDAFEAARRQLGQA